MSVQHEIAVGVAESFMGKTLKVLVESEADLRDIPNAKLHSWEHGFIRGEDSRSSSLGGRYLVARGEADAPDIDGRVYVRGQLPVGNFASVKIIGHTDYDLIAKPVLKMTTKGKLGAERRDPPLRD